jgi:hypothetical protein
MSKEKLEATAKANVEFSINFTLTIGEAKALLSIAKYNHQEFIDQFYKHFGKAYLGANEEDFLHLLKRIDTSLPNEISKIEHAKVAISEALKPFAK